MTSGRLPQLSLVIAAYNDWAALEKCLASVAGQRDAPDFEVLVVDDGSATHAPAAIAGRGWQFELRVVRQSHSGIAVARNRGVQEARGSVVLFTDCDCVIDPDCLRHLAQAAELFSGDASFQLRLTADTRSIVGRAEALQHFAVQQGRLDAAGRLMYLNTSGFAIRREAALEFGQLFDPLARRGEDTLLLSQLMKRGQMPHYLPDAAIQHAVRLPLGKYMWVGLSIGYKEGYAYAKVATNAEKLDSGTPQRWEQLKRLRRIAKEKSLGNAAFLAVFVRQVLRLVGLKFYRMFGLLCGSGSRICDRQVGWRCMAEVNATEILERLPKNIRGVVIESARANGERVALVETSGSWTYSEFDAAIAETQAWLAGLGVRAGDRVMIVSENCRALVAVLLAVAGMDAWAVPVNAKLSPQEIDAIRDHCGARRLIYTVTVSRAARDHAKRHDAATVEAGKLGPIAVGPLNENVAPEPLDANLDERVAAMIYTSGTTGLPKGVMLTHRNLLYLAGVSAAIRSLTPDDRLYGVLPMTHAVGLSVVLLGALLSGARLYLTTRFDPVAALSSMEKDALTIVLGVPSMFSVLLDYAKMKGMSSLRFPALRVISSSGAPLTATVKADTEKLLGLTLHNGYGVTECSPTIAQARLDEPRADLSVGKILPGMEVALIGSDGSAVAAGEIGELRVKGPNVMKGYYHAPEDTAEVLSADGWFNTKDLARLEGGHLFIVGRAKELIVRFGFNVYPAEVEAVMSALPGVARVAVVGRVIEATEGGEEVVAFVELTKGSTVGAGALNEHASKNLSPYKRPTKFVMLEAMPVTPTGKPMKGELAKMLDGKA